ncbi:unnamed protein product, partial [Polarella glacialis]
MQNVMWHLDGHRRVLVEDPLVDERKFYWRRLFCNMMRERNPTMHDSRLSSCADPQAWESQSSRFFMTGGCWRPDDMMRKLIYFPHGASEDTKLAFMAMVQKRVECNTMVFEEKKYSPSRSAEHELFLRTLGPSWDLPLPADRSVLEELRDAMRKLSAVSDSETSLSEDIASIDYHGAFLKSCEYSLSNFAKVSLDEFRQLVSDMPENKQLECRQNIEAFVRREAYFAWVELFWDIVDSEADDFEDQMNESLEVRSLCLYKSMQALHKEGLKLEWCSQMGSLTPGKLRQQASEQRCSYCHAVVAKSRRCQGCGSIYCSPQCLQEDWPKHKAPCKATQQARK